jgi:hypothetical protein
MFHYTKNWDLRGRGGMVVSRGASSVLFQAFDDGISGMAVSVGRIRVLPSLLV